MASILVTGGAGFIGSHVVDAYIKAGHTVSVADNLASGSLSNLNKKAKLYHIDVTSAKLEQVFKKEAPVFVNHLAAQISVKASMVDPVKDARINVLGSLNLLEMCHKFGTKKLLFSSTGGALYGEPQYLPCDEAHPINPLSAYGVAKRAVELYIQALAPLYGLRYTILRYANVYGPRQDPYGEAGVVAIFTERMLRGAALTINGTGNQSRDFVFVADVVKANLLALQRGDGCVYNIGVGASTSVNEMYRKLRRLIKYRRSPMYSPAVPGEVFNIMLDSREAARDLGWRPLTGIDEGLEKTVQYFQAEGRKQRG